MTNHFSRRQLMRGVAGTGLGIAAGLRPPALLSQAAQPYYEMSGSGPVPSWKTELRKLAPNVYAYTQQGGPGLLAQGISTAGAIVGEDNILVIDSLGAPLHAKNFLTLLRKEVPNKRIDRILITHHHGDHILGLPFFPKGTEIVSHEYCRKEMLAMTFPSPTWDKRDGWAEGGEERKVILPVTTISDSTTYYYGNTEVRVISAAPAHTFGDLMVYLPQYKILFAADVGFFFVAPFCHNAHPTKWMDAIDKVLAMDLDVIIPGHGPIGGKKELAQTAEYIGAFKAEARKRYDAGMTPGKAAADIKLGKFDAWIGAPDRLVMNTVRFFHEFKGDLIPTMDAEGNRLATIEFNSTRGSKN